jgi:hypothetical protein
MQIWVLPLKVIFRSKRKEWKHISDTPYPDEAYLQDMIYNSPDLIPFEDLGEDARPLILCVKELGLPGSGSTDLVGLDSEGAITIVECKLASNPEAKRKVIGQVLEYAAFLWEMSYDDFDRLIFEREGEPLVDLMAKRVLQPDWSQEMFRDSVERSLSEGKFRLVIVVDSINNELRRTIQYLNSRDQPNPQIHALELRYFPETNTEVEILVPHLYGISQGGRQVGSTKKITETEFLSQCEYPGRRLYAGLKELKKIGHEMRASTMSFSYYVSYGSRSFCPIVVYPKGVSILKWNLTPENGIGEEALNAFSGEVKEITSLRDKYDRMKEPNFGTKEGDITEEEIEIFLEAFGKLMESINA